MSELDVIGALAGTGKSSSVSMAFSSGQAAARHRQFQQARRRAGGRLMSVNQEGAKFLENGRGRKQFFFEKKNQKTFGNLLLGDFQIPRVKFKKVFCGAFLQKSDRLLDLVSVAP